MASQYWESVLYMHQPVQPQELSQSQSPSPTTNSPLVIPSSAPQPPLFSRARLTQPRTMMTFAITTAIAAVVPAIMTPFSVVNAMVLWLLIGIASLVWGSHTHHAGLIILGSMIASIGLATLLASMPAPTISTNVHTGLFLLAVASGWFLMTILSYRFTRSTQWWALIPGSMKVLTALAMFTS